MSILISFQNKLNYKNNLFILPPIAQRFRASDVNQKVAGESPAWGTKYILPLAKLAGVFTILTKK